MCTFVNCIILPVQSTWMGESKYVYECYIHNIRHYCCEETHLKNCLLDDSGRCTFTGILYLSKTPLEMSNFRDNEIFELFKLKYNYVNFSEGIFDYLKLHSSIFYDLDVILHSSLLHNNISRLHHFFWEFVPKKKKKYTEKFLTDSEERYRLICDLVLEDKLSSTEQKLKQCEIVTKNKKYHLSFTKNCAKLLTFDRTTHSDISAQSNKINQSLYTQKLNDIWQRRRLKRC